MDAGEPEPEDDIPDPNCNNSFNGIGNFCRLVDFQPTMCFQSYVAKRPQSILQEYTPIVGNTAGPPSAVQGKGHGKLTS
jgi:hypothetical protein